ncbi:glycosyltransferase [Microbacterium sp. LMI1-1-1.1]|uniref:glycosyltransferase n=1 Tax=Microbacterium sp. LMI1-1-1.1 TaxID=3135223 RepID=UPI0034675ED4
MSTTGAVRVLSLYEGFFAGGARILHSDVVAGLAAGGAQEHHVLSLTSSARRDGSVQRAADDGRYRGLRAAGVRITAFDRVAGDRPVAPEDFTADELAVASAAIADADVVLSLKEQPLSLVVALERAGMLPDRPLAVCLHRSDPTHSGPALEWLRHASASGAVTTTIACASSTAAAYAAAGVQVAEALVVDNGIDTGRFRPAVRGEKRAIRARLGIPERAPLVLLAARFDAMKDPGLFLRSVALHAARRPDAHYLVCGSGMTMANPGFAALVAASGIPSGTPLHALGLREDMPELYRAADIVALTSAFGEASPLCLAEGAASGATPVTTDVGDAARIVEGVGVVTDRDPVRVAAAWEHVLAHRGALRAAALLTRPRWDRSRMVEDYRAIVESMQLRDVLAA